MKPIKLIEGIDIPQHMREALSALPCEEQLTRFTLTKNYHEHYGVNSLHEKDVGLDRSKILAAEGKNVLAILVRDGIVVGVEVELREYFAYSTGVELFNQDSHKLHSIGFKCGGHYSDFVTIYAEYVFAYNGNQGSI